MDAIPELAASVGLLLLGSVVFVFLWRISWPEASREPFMSRFALFLAYLTFFAPAVTLLIVCLGAGMLISLRLVLHLIGI